MEETVKETVEETQAATGCYECGSPGGTMLKLCPECEQRYAVKRGNLQTRLHVDNVGTGDSLFYKVITLEGASSFIVFAAFFAIIFFAFMVGSIFGLHFSVMIVFTTAIVAAVVTVVAWAVVWTEALSIYKPLAYLSLACPPALYVFAFHAYKNRDQFPKWYFIRNALVAHALGVGLFLVTMIAAHSAGVMLFHPSVYFMPAKPKVTRHF